MFSLPIIRVLSIAVQEAADEAAPYQRQQIDEQNVSGLEELTGDGMEAHPFVKDVAAR